MRSKDVGRKIIALALAMSVLFYAASAYATVYGWKGDGGVLHLSNDPEDVPAAQRDSALKFTTKPVPVVSAPAPEPTPSTPDLAAASANLQLSAYERGLEHGLQAAEQHITLAGELARAMLAATPRTPPTRIVIQQPGPIVIHDVTPDYYYYPPAFYGFVGPSAPFGWGFFPSFSYAYGFRYGRFAPHSHFFPCVRGRCAGLFFPSGHFSHHGFLFGPSLVVR
jgi:hypothetical protein